MNKIRVEILVIHSHKRRHIFVCTYLVKILAYDAHAQCAQSPNRWLRLHGRSDHNSKETSQHLTRWNFFPPKLRRGGGQEKNGEPLAHGALLQNGLKFSSKNHSSLGMHKQRRDGHPLRHFAPHGPGLAAAG